jgi:hypothetical protein
MAGVYQATAMPRLGPLGAHPARLRAPLAQGSGAVGCRIALGHDPYAYLKDVLTRLPPQRASEIEQLLPHQWVLPT